MRALVTGATGFLGSHLTEHLLHARATVAVLTRPGTDPWRIAPLMPRLIRIEGDLRELAAIERDITEFAPDTVFHLGWHGVINRYRDDPAQIDANLWSTLNLIRLSLRIGCRTWIGLGSQAEYGPLNRLASEDDPAHPTTTYGAVKLCIRFVGERLAVDSGLRFVWLRLFSAYGPKDNPNWMIPTLIRTLLKGNRPALTACEQKWDYLYVADAVEAIYRVATTPAAKGVFNLGSGQAYPLRAVVEQIRDLVNPACELGFGEIPYRFDQVMHLEADIARLRTATGWTPRTPLAAGLRKTVSWYQQVDASICEGR